MDAKTYPDLFNWTTAEFSDPPLTVNFSNEAIKDFIHTPYSPPDIECPKKIAFWHFQHYQNYLGQNFFYSKNYRQKAITKQVLKIFGGCQNCQNQTFN